MPETTTRSLSTIAAEIRKIWRRKDGTPCVNFAAEPYLKAMESLDSINDNYGADPAGHIVAYFLGNATGFRGADARRIKAELSML